MAINKKIMAALAFLVLTGLASAERILSIDLDVYMNDYVTVRTLRIEEGYPTKYVRPGDYELTIEDLTGNKIYSKTLKIDHTIYTDPPRDINPAPVSIRATYTPDMKILKLTKNGSQIFSKEINICNGDGKCDTVYESSVGCPDDCRLDGFDGMCIKYGDGTCDPDCNTGADPDCVKPSAFTLMPYLTAGTLILIVAAYAIKKKIKKRA